MNSKAMKSQNRHLPSIKKQTETNQSFLSFKSNQTVRKDINAYARVQLNKRSLNESVKTNRISQQIAKPYNHSLNHLISLDSVLQKNSSVNTLDQNEQNQESSTQQYHQVKQQSHSSLRTIKIERKDAKLHDQCQNDKKCTQKLQIQWNNFKLIVNKKYKGKSFVCGNCLDCFNDTQDFVLHCLRQCQDIQNPKSSHFIKYKYQKDQQQNEQKDIYLSRIKQNEYSLIPNKKYQKNSLYYCGKCKKSLHNQQRLLQHILQNCFDFQNINSSHFIILKTVKKSNKQILDEKPTSNSKIMISNASNFCWSRNKLSKQYTQSFPVNLLGVFKLIQSRNQHQSELFICGCGKVSNQTRSSALHITRTHHEIVPQNSSHIFLRVGSDESLVVNMMLKIECRNEDNIKQIWSCPCKGEKTMNRKEFVNHIIKIHKGVSPFYKILNHTKEQ